MKLNKFRYKTLVWGLSALAFCSTSCKDFLDVDIYDNYSTESVKTYSDAQLMTRALYGGYKWFEYDQKFAWCVNEGIPGILFNVHQEEGALFLLSIGEDNPILKEGYTSLYSGVISSANQIIDKMNNMDNVEGATITDSQKDKIIAEACLFRAYAHFLATEYFGEVPLVLNTGKDLTENVAVPRVSRKTLYAAIEKDLKFAADHLDPAPADKWRASKYSAKALLAKLYLTMGSCVKDIPGTKYPFTVTESESKEYMSKAEKLCTEVIEESGASLSTHAEIFSAANRTNPSSESIFSLYFPLGNYGEGSAYQSQMAPEEIWSPGSGWGSGKGISYTLYNSFSSNDPRKKELCFYVGQEYQTVSGKVVYYGSKYADYGPDAHTKSGSEFLNSGQNVLNNVKKFIWGVDGTAFNDKGMAVDRRVDIIRLSDVYMMRAEAKMAQEDLDVTAKSSVGVDDINAVLSAHGAPSLDESQVALFDDMESQAVTEDVIFNVTVGESGTEEFAVKPKFPMYHTLVRKDLIQQRRKEFAMEGQAWLDLKRLFYRDYEMGMKFMRQMDRSIQFSQSPEVEDAALFESESGFARRQLVHDLNVVLAAAHPENSYNAGTEEYNIDLESFESNRAWFLPIPTSAKNYLKAEVEDLYDRVIADDYPY